MVALIGGEETVKAHRVINAAVWRIEWFARGLVDDTDKDSWHRAEEEYVAAINTFHERARRDIGVPGKYVNREARPEPPQRQADAR